MSTDSDTGTAANADARAGGCSRIDADDARYMRRAIELATRAEGLTAPNPLVGAVIADTSGIVGEGWHRGVGQPHAEADALRAAGSRARGATAYVTLEPCHHMGRTPPCTAGLISAGVARVVYAVTDPNPIASGGADALRAAGIRVDGGVEEAAARYLARAFLHHVETGKPWVIAKSATSLDGRIATRSGHSQWITGDAARLEAHRLRQAVDAILVGAGTVASDDPSLTVRLPEQDRPISEIRHPRPVVLDSHARVSPDARLLDGSLGTRTLHLVGNRIDAATRARLSDTAAELVELPVGSDGRIHVDDVLAALGAADMQSVLLEGGPRVHGAFLDAGAIDEVAAFIAPLLIGGADAPASFAGRGAALLDDALGLTDVSIATCGPDLLLRGVTRRSSNTVLTPRLQHAAGASASRARHVAA